MFNYVLLMIIFGMFSPSLFCMETKETTKESSLFTFMKNVAVGSIAGASEMPIGRVLSNVMYNKINVSNKGYVERTPFQGWKGHLGSIVPVTVFQVVLDGILKKNMGETESAVTAGGLSTIVVAPSTNIVIQQKPKESLKSTIVTMYKKEGFKAFYKGWAQEIKKEALFTLGYLKLKKEVDCIIKESITTNLVGTTFISSVACGVPLSLFTQPLTNIGSSIQHGFSRSYLDTFKYMRSDNKQIFSELMKGWKPRMLRYCIALALISTVCEQMNKVFEKTSN